MDNAAPIPARALDRPRLPPELLQAAHRRSDAHGVAMLAANHALVALAFAAVVAAHGAWAWVAVPAALVVLGGRQLGLGILMHECAHRSLFRTPALNEAAGQWLCAAPMGADLHVYRSYHMTHHRATGTGEDPDLPNYAGYPVAGPSFARKVLRDLSGVTGAKALATLVVLYAQRDPATLRTGYAYRAGTPSATASPAERLANLARNGWRIALVQLAGFALLAALGHPAAWLLWPLAWLTTYMLFSRVRNAAEHGALPGTHTPDPWTNTRSVRAGWLARLTVAPNHVNWHLEHHLWPAVPSYRLPALHRWLADNGWLARAQVAPGYGAVVRALVR